MTTTVAKMELMMGKMISRSQLKNYNKEERLGEPVQQTMANILEQFDKIPNLMKK